jgi:anaerobic ribonucleoside-triphosphate reductase activating protein
MNYAEIKNCDIANGYGVRVSLFVSGCTHHCKGCFNQIAWDFSYGEKFTQKVEDEIISLCQKEYIDGLSLLGGEPFEKENQIGLLSLLKRFKKEFPDKDIWCYSGYLFDQDIMNDNSSIHTDVTRDLVNLIDVLVDGEFVEDLKDISLQFKGSSNQRIIDVKKSLKANKIVLYDQVRS